MDGTLRKSKATKSLTTFPLVMFYNYRSSNNILSTCLLTLLCDQKNKFHDSHC